MINLTTDDYWQLLKRRSVYGLHAVPRWLFVRHSHTVDVVAVMMVLLLATVLVVGLLYVKPNDIQVADSGQASLSTEIIDRLELWLEERNNELDKKLTIPNPAIFR